MPRKIEPLPHDRRRFPSDTRMPTMRAGGMDAPLASCQDILALSRPQARCVSPLDLPLQLPADEISFEFP